MKHPSLWTALLLLLLISHKQVYAGTAQNSSRSIQISPSLKDTSNSTQLDSDHIPVTVLVPTGTQIVLAYEGTTRTVAVNASITGGGQPTPTNTVVVFVKGSSARYVFPAFRPTFVFYTFLQ